MSKYENCDFCGPQVVDWKTRMLSFIIPDNLWGVYIGDLCEAHDFCYEIGGNEEDKLYADDLFRYQIFHRLLPETNMFKARLGANLYYYGVRSKRASKQFNFNSKDF